VNKVAILKYKGRSIIFAIPMLLLFENL